MACDEDNKERHEIDKDVEQRNWERHIENRVASMYENQIRQLKAQLQYQVVRNDCLMKLILDYQLLTAPLLSIKVLG